MTKDYGQSILETCLAEVVGGVRPPDLSQRILHAWAERQAESSKKPVVDLDEPVLDARTYGTRPMVVVEQLTEPPEPSDPSWLTEEPPRSAASSRALPYIAAAVLLAGVTLGSFWLWRPASEAAGRGAAGIPRDAPRSASDQAPAEDPRR